METTSGSFCATSSRVGGSTHLSRTTEGREPGVSPALGYVEALADLLVQASRSLSEDPTKLECWSVTLDLRYDYNAASEAATGRISLNPKLLLVLHSDAAVASVLAHELSHLVLHTSLEVHPVTQADPEWQAQAERWRRLQARISQCDRTGGLAQSLPRGGRRAESHRHGRHALMAAAHRARVAMTERERQLLGPEVWANWREQLADEFGLELYLKAGFRARDYLKEPLEFLLQHIGQGQAYDCSTNRPARGRAHHPSLAWRLHHIERHQQHLDRTSPELGALIRTNTLVNPLGSWLTRAQRWLRQQAQ